MVNAKNTLATLIPVPPSGCGTITDKTCSMSNPEKIVTLTTSQKMSKTLPSLPPNPDPVTSRASYACDGTCPGITSKNSLMATMTSSPAGSAGSDIPKLSCANSTGTAYAAGILNGILGAVTGGLASELWNPVDESYYEKLQEEVNSMQSSLTACEQACAQLIQSDSYNFICCSVSFLNIWTKNNLQILSQQIKTNQLMVHLALGLIVLILIYILTS